MLNKTKNTEKSSYFVQGECLQLLEFPVLLTVSKCLKTGRFSWGRQKTLLRSAVSCCKVSASETLRLFREIAEKVLVVEVVPKAYSCNWLNIFWRNLQKLNEKNVGPIGKSAADVIGVTGWSRQLWEHTLTPDRSAVHQDPGDPHCQGAVQQASEPTTLSEVHLRGVRGSVDQPWLFSENQSSFHTVPRQTAEDYATTQ